MPYFFELQALSISYLPNAFMIIIILKHSFPNFNPRCNHFSRNTRMFLFIMVIVQYVFCIIFFRGKQISVQRKFTTSHSTSDRGAIDAEPAWDYFLARTTKAWLMTDSGTQRDFLSSTQTACYAYPMTSNSDSGSTSKRPVSIFLVSFSQNNSKTTLNIVRIFFNKTSNFMTCKLCGLRINCIN